MGKKNKKKSRSTRDSSHETASSKVEVKDHDQDMEGVVKDENEQLESSTRTPLPAPASSKTTATTTAPTTSSSNRKRPHDDASASMGIDNDNDHDHSNQDNDGVSLDDKKAKRTKSKTESIENEDDNNKSNNEKEEKPNFFSTNPNDLFTNLPLSDKTQTALQEMEMTRMTQIQSLAIPPLLTGKDVVGAAKTGSGKTLAFLIPSIELLHKAKFQHKNGTGVLVIAPTRELAMQIFGVLQEVCNKGKHSQTFGLIMGGANRKTEAEKLTRGVNIVVATPGRLLDHLQNTRGFNVRNLLVLVMDEADRILEQGFEDDLRAILKILPKERQTMLFSATQTKKIEDLVRVSINPKNSVFVDVPSETNFATVEGLEQGFVTVPSDKRFLLLFTFLKKNKKKKVMVFFSSCNSVKFHAELLNYIDVPVLDIHGRQKQVKRTTTFFQFCKSESGTLLCTDVCARGLDIPKVDWIIQFDPPDDPKEYIHRVGRTARGATGSGRALLFLTPEETGFLRYLKAAQVTLNEYEFPTHKVANVQSQLQRLIEGNYYLNRAARDAYRSYLLSYASHSLRDIFNVHQLDLQAVGTAFGFTSPPRCDLAFVGGVKERRSSSKKKLNVAADDSKHKHGKKKMMGQLAGSGHAFSASNPYGKRDPKDQRQFSH